MNKKQLKEKLGILEIEIESLDSQIRTREIRIAFIDDYFERCSQREDIEDLEKLLKQLLKERQQLKDEFNSRFETDEFIEEAFNE